MKEVEREILLGFWKVHILHHAGEEPVYGQWILEELQVPIMKIRTRTVCCFGRTCVRENEPAGKRHDLSAETEPKPATGRIPVRLPFRACARRATDF